jgi:hypothetical protein
MLIHSALRRPYVVDGRRRPEPQLGKLAASAAKTAISAKRES